MSRTVTANTNLLPTDDVLYCDCTSGDIIVTLFDLTPYWESGQTFRIGIVKKDFTNHKLILRPYSGSPAVQWNITKSYANTFQGSMQDVIIPNNSLFNSSIALLGINLVWKNVTSNYSIPSDIDPYLNISQQPLINNVQYNGTLFGCGFNQYYAIDNSLNTSITTMEQMTATQPYNNFYFKSICCGNGVYLGIDKDNLLYAWGSTITAQLAVLGGVPLTVPTLVNNNITWRKVLCYNSDAIIGIKTDGTLWGSGGNSKGTLGQGNTTAQTTWIQIGTDNRWVDISLSYNGSLLAKRIDRTLWGCGNNLSGQLGIGNTTTPITSLTQAGVATNWSKISIGAMSLCTTIDGKLWYSGIPQWKSGTGVTSFTQEGTDTNWADCISDIGDYYIMALKTNGTLWTGGYNSQGQLGNGNTTMQTSLAQVGNDTDWVQISRSNQSSYALKASGALYGCGKNSDGQLGDGTTNNSNIFKCIGTNIYSKLMTNLGERGCLIAIK